MTTGGGNGREEDCTFVATFDWDALVDAWIAEESAHPGFDAAALIETAGGALSDAAKPTSPSMAID